MRAQKNFRCVALRAMLVALTATFGVTSCTRQDSPEQQVRATVAAAEAGAEARDVGAVMELVAPDYADARGFDVAQLRQFVRGYFLVNQTVNLLVRIESIEFPAPALAKVRASIGSLNRRGDPDDWALAANVRSFQLEFVRDGDDWRLRRADFAETP